MPACSQVIAVWCSVSSSVRLEGRKLQYLALHRRNQDMSLITRLAFCGVASLSISIGSHADDPVQVLHSWGSNSNDIDEVPIELLEAMEESRIVQLTDSGNSGHIGAVLDDGRIFLWGLNNDGQCDPPGDVGTIFDPVVSVATGPKHTIALMQDGRLVCWGNNDGNKSAGPLAGPPGCVALV